MEAFCSRRDVEFLTSAARPAQIECTLGELKEGSTRFGGISGLRQLCGVVPGAWW